MSLEDASRKQVRFLFLALTMIRPVIIVEPLYLSERIVTHMKKLLVFITTFITIFALCINTIAPVSAQSRTPQTETVTPKTTKSVTKSAKAPKLTATKSAPKLPSTTSAIKLTPTAPTKTAKATKARAPKLTPTKSTHRHKQVLANKIYPRTTAVPTKTNVISFDGKDLPIGDFTLPNIYSDLSTSQRAIDAGQIVQGYYTLDNNDNHVTYLAGHNPGVLTPLEQYADLGKTIDVHDKNGNVKTYRFTRMIPTPSNGYTMSQEAISYMNTHMSDHEGLLIQWCRPDLNQMQLWLLDPVA